MRAIWQSQVRALRAPGVEVPPGAKRLLERVRGQILREPGFLVMYTR